MSTNLYGYKPSKVTVVKHHNRDITFMIPQVEPEVGFLQANYDKRLATAVKWASERFRDPLTGNFCTGEPVITEFENTSLKGYTIETLNGRYRTEVEYILVRHPEGYVFEVPFQNLLDIIKEVGCGVGGVIEKPCYVQAVGGKWRLVPVGGSMEGGAISGDKEIRALYAKKVSNSKKKLSVGDVIKMRDSEGYWVYVGKHKLSVDVEYEGSVWEYARREGRPYDIDYYKMTCTSVTKVTPLEGAKVLATSELLGGGRKEAVHEFEEFDVAYMVFARISGVSKSTSWSNGAFMKSGYQEKHYSKHEVALFKGKSVQFEHTGESDMGTVKEFLTGVYKYEYCGVGGLHHWDAFKGYEKLVGAHNSIGGFGRSNQVGAVHKKGMQVKVGDVKTSTREHGTLQIRSALGLEGFSQRQSAKLLLKYDPV